MTIRQQENLLSRWSRRKQQAREKTEPANPERIDTQQNLSQKEPEASLSSSEDLLEAQSEPEPDVVLTDEDMPPIESLTENSDFSGFMSRGVSDELRNLALRKMYSAASFNVLDGLDDYADDYTSFEKLGDIVTSDMKHRIEMEASRKLEQEAEKLIKSETEPSPEEPQDGPHGSTQSIETQDEQNEPARSELSPEPETLHE